MHGMRHRQFRLNPENGLIQFLLFGDLVYETQEVAILFDSFTGLLLGHGTPQQIEEKYERLNNSSYVGGHKWFQGQFKVEDLNEMIFEDGYVKTFWERLQEERDSID